MGRRGIRLRTIWSPPLRCDPRQPAAGGRSLRVPARRFHLACAGAGRSSNRGRLITEIVTFSPDTFPLFGLPMLMDPGAGDECASLIVILLGPRYFRKISGTESTFERRTKMSPKFLEKQSTRREMLRNSAGFTGSALLAQLFPASLLSAGVPGLRQQAATAPTDHLAAIRAQMGATPIQAQPLAENLTLLSGPGGNVVVLNGARWRPLCERGSRFSVQPPERSYLPGSR